MTNIDWIVLIGTQVLIVSYGLWMSRGSKDIRGYLLSDKSMNWFTIGLSIMATQASAITFLSTPGQAYGDGMRFLHFYLGLPIAMVVISAVAVPIYHRLNVYTAYEYLENRFDLRMRSLGALLFLSQRSLAAGLSIYAPAIILSKVLGWPVSTLCLVIGLLVVFYTVTGGTKAVSYTQKQQMLVILLGMGIAGYMLVHQLPEGVGLPEAVHIAGKMDKLNVIDLSFRWDDRYNIWTGLIGGFFLALSYFGTDQSQVQRYLGGKSIGESRLGLLMNGIVKIPMQFLILFVGTLLFVFYMFNPAPIHFNTAALDVAYEQGKADQLKPLEMRLQEVQGEKREAMGLWASVIGDEAAEAPIKGRIDAYEKVETEIREDAAKIIHGIDGEEEVEKILVKDRDYVFITFVTNQLPTGIVGLLIAVILSAAMSSASSELNALATTTVVDVYKRSIKKEGSDKHYLNASKLLTLFWGLFAIGFTQFADQLDNLIQAVNVLGSLVYGVILGIFVVAFFVKKVQSTAVFYAAIISEAIVLYCYFAEVVPYLWLNVIGCLPVVLLSLLFQRFKPIKNA